MFTGIVEEPGEIVAVSEDEGGRLLRVAASFARELERGQSIAVSGACLTVESVNGDTFEVFLSQETLERTYLDDAGEGHEVNLERALPADGRFDGHFVQGHVDGTARVVSIEQVGDDWEFVVSLPQDLEPYVVKKGSIAVDGISLTVADLRDGDFSVAVIPETYELTNISDKGVGDPVHIEVDVVAKYVESLVNGYQG